MDQNGTKRCDSCLWYEQCEEAHGCGDYSPVDEEPGDFEYYRAVIAEAAAEYEDFVKEMEG